MFIMKDNLMEYLVCPDCKTEFSLDVYKEQEEEIEESLLKCKSCGTSFPIIKYVPRILSEEHLKTLVTGYQDFVSRYGKAELAKPFYKVYGSDEKIARGFEYEWQKHPKILPEHQKEFSKVLGDVLIPDEMKGKTILDAGCGQGRFSYFMQKYGASIVISIDLGEKTLLAYKNLKGIKNVHVVQTSIYNPPFKPVFDLIVSIGVIHHLPSPEEGFRSLYKLLKQQGRIFIWVYGYTSIIPVIKFIRNFTQNRSLQFNRFIGFFLAVPLLCDQPVLQPS